jgi:hypothetical protein
LERFKAELDAQTQIVVAQMQHELGVKQASITARGMQEKEGLTETGDDGEEKPTSGLTSLVEAINQNMMQMAQGQQMIVEHLSRPKQIVRDANGRAAGVV